MVNKNEYTPEYSAIPRVKISKDMDIPKRLLNNVE